MASSGSTPPQSADDPVRLFLEVVGDDHPRACTGRRLIQRGLARRVPPNRSLHPAPVLLDPYAAEVLSPRDQGAALRGGILAVDCSWNRLSQRGTLGRREGSRSSRPRRLPLLVAANPQHYGRFAELNTVEALSGALAVLGARGQAARLLEGFRGGPEFLTINETRLAAYAAAPDADGVRALERRFHSGATG